MRATVPSGAGPESPDHNHGGIPAIKEAAERPLRSVAALMARATTPAPMKTHAISDSVHTVTAAVMKNRIHESRFEPSVLLVSFQALLAMTAITAAPTP